MKNLILVLVCLVPFYSFSQKIKRHEIGLGIGYNQLYPNKDFKLDYIQYLFSKKQIAEYNGKKRNNVKGFTTPTFYYTFYPYNDFTFRSSIRYINILSIEPEYVYSQWDDFSFSNYQLKVVESSFGFSLRIINRKLFEIYSGLEVEYIYSKYSEKIEKFNPEFEVNKNGFLKYFFGYNQKLDEHFNIKLESSIIVNDLLIIRPINRLSLNYRF